MSCDHHNQFHANHMTFHGAMGTTLGWNVSATKPFACCHLKGRCTSPSILVPATWCTCQLKEEMHTSLSYSGSSCLDQPFRRYEANNPKLTNMILLLTVKGGFPSSQKPQFNLIIPPITSHLVLSSTVVNGQVQSRMVANDLTIMQVFVQKHPGPTVPWVSKDTLYS